MFEEAIDPITKEINWQCECFKGKSNGPCGELFRKVFTLFVENQEHPEIPDLMMQLQECFEQYLDLYPEDEN